MSQTNEGNSANVQDDVMNADSNSFFDDLERQVNSGIFDETSDEGNATAKEQATPPSKAVSKSNGVDYESDDNPYKKRYSDSSREAQKLAEANKQNEPYDAINNVMKKDPQLVDTVKDYLENGPKERSLKEEIGIPDDFVFDPDEAFSNPKSPSAQVFDRAVDRVVEDRLKHTESKVANTLSDRDNKAKVKQEAEAWMKKNNVSEKEFEDMMKKATDYKIGYDDIHFLLNKDRVKGNISKSVKSGRVEQMKNVRSVPQTAGGTGSADVSDITEDDRVFNAIKNSDKGSLFDSVD